MSELQSGFDDGPKLVETRPLPPCYVPRRWILAIIVFSGIIGTHLLRTVLSVALHSLGPQYSWSNSTQGLIMASYFWGYCAFNVPAGFLVNKFGVKRPMAISVFIGAVLTLILPFCVPSVPTLISLRVLLGLAEAVALPAAMHFVATWFPRNEQSTASAFVVSGTSVGVVIALSFGPLVQNYIDWESIFYMSATYAFLWLVPWLLLFSDRPSHSSSFTLIKIHPLEVAQIEYERDSELIKRRFGLFDELQDAPSGIPWVALFTHRAVIALTVAHFCHMYGNYLFQSWLLPYLTDNLHYSLQQSGLIADIPFFLAPLILTGSGAMVDYLANRRKSVSITTARKIFNGLAQLSSCAAFLVLGFATVSDLSATILIIMSATTTAFNGGLSGNFVDLSPKYASIIFSFVNTIGTIPGFLGVYLTGVILDAADNNWTVIFIIGASLFAFAAIIYSIFGQARRVDFDAVSSLRWKGFCTGQVEVEPWQRYEAQASARIAVNTESSGLLS